MEKIKQALYLIYLKYLENDIYKKRNRELEKEIQDWIEDYGLLKLQYQSFFETTQKNLRPRIFKMIKEAAKQRTYINYQLKKG